MSSHHTVRATVLANLVEEIRGYTESRGITNPYTTAIKGFLILRSDLPKVPSYRLFQPALCITVQSGKWATFGEMGIDPKTLKWEPMPEATEEPTDEEEEPAPIAAISSGDALTIAQAKQGLALTFAFRSKRSKSRSGAKRHSWSPA